MYKTNSEKKMICKLYLTVNIRNANRMMVFGLQCPPIYTLIFSFIYQIDSAAFAYNSLYITMYWVE